MGFLNHSFPWITYWLAMPLTGAFIIRKGRVTKGRAYLIGLWCVGWAICLASYLLIAHPFQQESYSRILLTLQLSPEALYIALFLCGMAILSLGATKEYPRYLLFCLSLGLALTVCMDWLWIASIIEVFSFTLVLRQNIVPSWHLWIPHIASLFAMVLFIFKAVSTTGTTLKNDFSFEAYFLAIALFLRFPLWPFYKAAILSLKRSDLFGSLFRDIGWWAISGWILHPYSLPRGIFWGGAFFSCLTLVRAGPYSGLSHAGFYWLLLHHPIYFAGELNQKLLLPMMINEALVLIGGHELMRALSSRDQPNPWKLALVSMLGWSVISQSLWAWKGLPFPLSGMACLGYGWWTFKTISFLNPSLKREASFFEKGVCILLGGWNLWASYEFFF